MVTEFVIYVFWVFIGIIGGTYKTYSCGSILTFVDKVRVLSFAHENKVRSMFLVIIVFMMVYFDVFRQCERFNIRL